MRPFTERSSSATWSRSAMALSRLSALAAGVALQPAAAGLGLAPPSSLARALQRAGSPDAAEYMRTIRAGYDEGQGAAAEALAAAFRCGVSQNQAAADLGIRQSSISRALQRGRAADAPGHLKAIRAGYDQGQARIEHYRGALRQAAR